MPAPPSDDRLVVHISADYPDAMAPAKTAVVRRLVEASAAANHIVYSLNRTDGWSGVTALPTNDRVLSIAYGAPPKGLRHRSRLLDVAAFIADDMQARGLKPRLLHAHKLTVEGLVVEELARRFAVPYVITIQGDTDMKIAGVRRDLIPRFRRIAKGARRLWTLAPWSRRATADLLQIPEDAIGLLPCLTAEDALAPAAPIGAPRFASIFHLASARRKNLDGLALAARTAQASLPGLVIDVIGGGGAADVLAAKAMAAAAGAEHCLNFVGPLSQQEIRARLPGYAAMVLPTRRESYGLVHVEALFAGVPILWSAERGVDGLFDRLIAGYRCDPNRTDDIARGLVTLQEREAEFKAAIARAQAEGALDHLRRSRIVADYDACLREALGS